MASEMLHGAVRGRNHTTIGERRRRSHRGRRDQVCRMAWCGGSRLMCRETGHARNRGRDDAARHRKRRADECGSSVVMNRCRRVAGGPRAAIVFLS
jgi:hypothetical protein